MKDPIFPRIKTPKGRAVGERIPGGVALVIHKNRHATPGLLAQTKRLLAAGSAIASPDEHYATEDLRRKADHQDRVETALTHQTLPPEPAPATVNAVATESPMNTPNLKENVRIGLASQLTITLPEELSKQIGRVSIPVVSSSEDEIAFRFYPKEDGYQWSNYQDGLRRLGIYEHMFGHEGVDPFRLTPVDRCFVYEDGVELVVKKADLRPPKQYTAPKNARRSSPSERTPDLGPKGRQQAQGTREQELAQAVDSLPPPSETTQNAVTEAQIREAIQTINRAKDERGRLLRLSLDTTTGKVHASLVQEIFLA